MGRWRFLDKTNAAELAEYERVIRGIDAWWAEFRRRERDLVAQLSGHRDWDLPNWMQTHLGALDPRIMWEFGPAVKVDGRRLVITPESARDLRPLVDELLARAPSLPKWEFYPYRLAEDLEMAKLTVEARTQGDLEGVRVCVSRAEHNLVDLVFQCPKAKEPDDEQAMSDVFVAAETLLGERILDRWIDEIHVVPLPASRRALSKWFGKEPSEGLAPSLELSELRPEVERLIEEIRTALPRGPRHLFAGDEWTLLELEPDAAEDYAEQEDLIVAKARHLDVWQAAHATSLFFDERFSHLGESFVFVKFERSEGFDLDQKSEMEDQLDALLLPAGLGCQIGGGTGTSYSYIDLVLTDLERGLDAVCARLRQSNVPRRSWIQFFDADLKHEWVGVYPDSPPPPLSEPDD